MNPGEENLKPVKERIAVILPAFNEEQTIRDTIEAFHRTLPQAAIYVINNNSNDKTAAISRATLHEHHVSGAVIDELRQGKGNALRRAFQDIEADFYLLADADMTYPSEQAWELLAPIRDDKADMVVGERFSNGQYARKNKRPFHNFGNRLVQGTVNMLFASKLTDVMSGYRAFSRRFVKNYPILVEGFQIETDMTLHALHNRFRILEIPITYRDRPVGSSSKLHTFSDGAKVIFTIAQILRYYHPLFFFSLLAALFTGCGFWAAIPVFRDWIEARFIFHVPLAILAAALEMVAIMLLGIGLMLDSQVYHQKVNYQLHLLKQERSETSPFTAKAK
jgi:glycosyltransferase involved in cell wall biosynthesis